VSNNPLKSWEHPTGSGIRIRQKVNTSGTDAYGVSFAVTVPVKITGGARERKQFRTQKEAEDFALHQWKGFQKQGESYFEATAAERIEFINTLPKLRKAGVSLIEAVEFALPRLRPAGGDRAFKEVIDELRESKKAMLDRGTLREHSERAFRIRTKKIVTAFGDLLVRDLTLDKTRAWLESLEVAPRTVKNQLNCLAEVLRYSVSRKYVFENILDGLTNNDRREIYGTDEEKEPGILTPEEASRLLNTAAEHPELNLLAAVVLGLFCGIRTEELKKLNWEDIRLNESFVRVSGKIAKKRRIRNVTLPEDAKRWLTLCPAREGQITRSNNRNDFDRRFRKLQLLAGFVAWKKNAMRHSFGSYHFALHDDSIKTSNELGHRQGDNVLFDYYRSLVTKEKAEEYFSIVPKSEVAKVVSFAS
jgi:integrase